MPFQLPADVNLNSPQIKLISDWNEGYNQLNVEILEELMHKDFRYLVYPQTIGELETSKEVWIEAVAKLFGYLIEVDTTCLSIIEAPGRIVAHTISEVVTTVGLDTAHEALFIVHIVPDDDGSLKIKTIETFRDSKLYLEYSNLLRVARAANT